MRDGQRDRALDVALAIAAALAGVVRDPSAPAADAKRALSLVVALAACAIVLVRSPAARRFRLAPRAPHLALGAIGVSAASALYGLPSGLLDLGTWVAGVALAVAIGSLGRAHAIATLRTTALSLGGGASAIALAQAARGAAGMHLEGGQGNPNWLGLLLAVTLPLSLDALRAHVRALVRARARGGDARHTTLAGTCAVTAITAITATAQLAALYASHSRVAWLAALIALPIVFHRRETARARVVAVGVAVALTAVVAAVAIARQERASSPVAKASSGTHASHARVEHDAEGSAEVAHDAPLGTALGGRLAIARTSALAAWTELPFGAGLGRFGHVYLAAQGEQLASLPPREASRRFLNATTAHDEWLQVAVESGPLALGLLAAAFALAAWAQLRARYAAGAASLVACAVCAVADSPLRQPAIVIVVALLFAALPSQREAAVTTSWRRRAPLLVALAACGLALPVAARSYLAARLRTQALDALPAARLPLLAKSARLDPGSGESALDLGLARLEADDPEGALSALRRSRALLANVGTSIAIGNAELARGKPELAEPAYLEALALHPGSLRAHADLAEALRQLGKLDEAESHARTALSISPGDARLRELVDRIHRDRMDASGDVP
jgi:tetratricopeptide (TPR) repeat protein